MTRGLNESLHRQHDAATKKASLNADFNASLISNHSVYAAIRKESLRGVSLLLSTMFERADDVFFEKAQKLISSQEQETYFAAMREIRLLRKGAEKSIFEQLSSYFSNLPDPNSAVHIPKIEAVDSFETLSLMETDDLEKNVAFDTMISRARSENSRQLSFLASGLNAIVSEADVTLDKLPLAPKQVCDVFRYATDKLDCVIECKLMLYKLFEREVLDHLSSVLISANKILQDAGFHRVAEEEKEAAQPSSTDAVSSGVAGNAQLPESADSTAYAGGGIVVPEQSLYSLLTQAASGQLGSERVNGQAPLGGAEQDAIAISDLVDSLSTLQSQYSSRQVYSKQGVANTQMPVEKLLVQQYRQSHEKESDAHVSSLDSEAINFVTMIFDFILGDENLSIPVKELLGRLQIPLIKVALLDRSFFTNTIHPARKLLNNLGRAGLSLCEENSNYEDDVVFLKIQSTVECVLTQFEHNIELFAELGEGFSIFLKSEEKRAKLLEQRMLLAEQGRAASEEARSMAVSIVNTSLQDHDIPPLIETILRDTWVKVLSYSYVKNGGDSRDFQKKRSVSSNIVRSVTPPKTKVERRFVESMSATALKSFSDGLVQAGLDDFDLKNHIGQIEKAQKLALKEFDHPTEPMRSGAALTKGDVPREADAASDSRDPASVTLAVSKPAANDQTFDKERQRKASAVPVTVQPGAWVDVSHDGTRCYEPVLRCKLAAHIKAVDRLVFIDRRGKKVLELGSQKFESLLSNKGLILIDEGLVFERALESVVGNLRSVQAKGAHS